MCSKTNTDIDNGAGKQKRTGLGHHPECNEMVLNIQSNNCGVRSKGWIGYAKAQKATWNHIWIWKYRHWYWDRYTETDRIRTPPGMQRNGAQQPNIQLRCAEKMEEKATQKWKKVHEINVATNKTYRKGWLLTAATHPGVQPTDHSNKQDYRGRGGRWQRPLTLETN